MAIGAPTLGPKPPDVTTPIRRAVGGDDLRPLARRRASVRPQSDAQPARSVRQRVPDALDAGKAALDATALLDRPCERRLDRVDALVEFVAVEAQPRLEPERVARAEPDRGDVGLGQQQAGQHLGARRRKRNLVAVLAGVAGAGDEGLDVAESGGPGAHERHVLQGLARRETREGRRGERSLDRDQRRVVERRQAHACRQALANESEVDGLARRVDDEPQDAVGAGRAGHHQVVDDSAAFVQELRVALSARREVDDVRGNERFEKGGDARVVGALEQRLAHMRDIEQAGRPAGMQMLGKDAGRVLDRHVVAGERRHAGAELDVERVEGRLPNRIVDHGTIAMNRRRTNRRAAQERPTVRTRPLCPMT